MKWVTKYPQQESLKKTHENQQICVAGKCCDWKKGLR
jgi:hypothetical protein